MQWLYGFYTVKLYGWVCVNFVEVARMVTWWRMGGVGELRSVIRRDIYTQRQTRGTHSLCLSVHCWSKLRKPWQPFNGLSQSNRFRALTMDPGTKPDSSRLIVQNLCVYARVCKCVYCWSYSVPVTKVIDSHYEDRTDRHFLPVSLLVLTGLIKWVLQLICCANI